MCFNNSIISVCVEGDVFSGTNSPAVLLPIVCVSEAGVWRVYKHPGHWQAGWLGHLDSPMSCPEVMTPPLLRTTTI